MRRDISVTIKVDKETHERFHNHARRLRRHDAPDKSERPARVLRALLRICAESWAPPDPRWVEEETRWPIGGRPKRFYLRLDSGLYQRLQDRAQRFCAGDVAVLVRVVVREYLSGRRQLDTTTLAEEGLHESTRRKVRAGQRELPSRRRRQLGLDHPLKAIGL